MGTPHIAAKKGDIAKSILLPGDPKRAKYIAENFLENPVCFNEVRGMLGYTGEYKGKKISVMGTGMGIPSISIYINELMSEYGCENLIRIGTCGSFKAEIGLGDVVIAMGACSDAGFLRNTFAGDFSAIADFDLLKTAYEKAVEKGKKVTVGNILSSEMFYPMWDNEMFNNWEKFGVIGVEMEAAALYTISKKYNAKALAICTVSDNFKVPGIMTPEERETTLNDMITIGLETALEFTK